jgi:imidazole glycerol-phosphate synthase subunit HisF
VSKLTYPYERIDVARCEARVATRVVACLDIRDGRVVKGTRFVDLVDLGDPVVCAERYAEGGADEIVLLDVRATAESRIASLATVERVRSAISVPLTVGGGLRSLADASRLFDAGADRVSVNSAAFLRPRLIADIAERYGTQAVVLAIDTQERAVPGGHLPGGEVMLRAGTLATGCAALDWAIEAARRGAGELLLTALDRDGTGRGYDTGCLALIASRVRVPIIASGGARTPEHLIDAIRAGADAVLVAGMLHRNEMTVRSLKESLASAGVRVRPC